MYAHGPEKKDCEFDDEPLEDSVVEQELNQCDEEDYGWQCRDQEPAQFGDAGRCQEDDPLISEA